MNPQAFHATKMDAITRGVGTSCDLAHQLRPLRWGRLTAARLATGASPAPSATIFLLWKNSLAAIF